MKSLKAITGKLHNKYLYACAIFFTIPCIAEASEAGSQLKEGGGKVVGLIMWFAFIIAVVIAVVGGVKLSKGEKETGKMMLVGGGAIAGAFLIVKILFAAFGAADAASDASYDF
ncbi:MAG: hypothetical protein GY750_04900 [Lentisphaerae bacterium]|nr:hypothetical protein [bacterium]MCP4100751.1 hypothetical protein [Lentisphaerota bacterium]